MEHMSPTVFVNSIEKDSTVTIQDPFKDCILISKVGYQMYTNVCIFCM